MSDSAKLQELDSILCDDVNPADYEELQMSWIDNAVTESHDANDKTNAPSPCDAHPDDPASGGPTTARKTSNTSPFPTDDALSPLELQVDRDTAAQVFRMTPAAPSHNGKSETCARLGSSDPFNEKGRDADSLLEDFSSVIKCLSSGVQIDAADDDMTERLAGFGDKQAPADTSFIVRSDPAHMIHRLPKDSLSDAKSRAAASACDEATGGALPVPGSGAVSTLKPPPQASVATAHKPSAKRKRRAGASTAAKKSARGEKSNIAPRASANDTDADSAANDVSLHSQDEGRGNATKRAKIGEKKQTQPSTVVGPDSEQMQVVYRMVNYMIETFTDPKLVRDIVDAVALCTAEHKKNVRTFAHLPGSILDHLLDVLEPAEFIRVFNLFKPSSVHGSAGTASTGLMAPDYTVSKLSNAKSESNPAASGTGMNYQTSPGGLAIGSSFTVMADREYIPDLLEAAVGYGFHLAALHPESMDVDMHTFLTQGASTVLEMNLMERRLLWKYLMNKESDNHPHHSNGASPHYGTGEPFSSTPSHRSSQAPMNQSASDQSPGAVAGDFHVAQPQSPHISESVEV